MEDKTTLENFGEPVFMLDENGEVFISDNINLGHIIALRDIISGMVRQLSPLKLGGKKE